MRIFLLGAFIALVVFFAIGFARPTSAEIKSYAIVQSDGSLRIQGHTVRLLGIYIPHTGQTCQTSVRPARCGSRAVLALEFRIQGFVKCEPWRRNTDGSIDAVCLVRGQGSVLSPPEDLGAWLIKQGWAVALPDAPFEYAIFEEIARTQHRGIWGFLADSVR